MTTLHRVETFFIAFDFLFLIYINILLASDESPDPDPPVSLVLRCRTFLSFFLSLALFALLAEDYDGDGFDDETGAYIGDGSYDPSEGQYPDGNDPDGSGSYDDGSGSYDDGSGTYDDGTSDSSWQDYLGMDTDDDGLLDVEEDYGIEITVITSESYSEWVWDDSLGETVEMQYETTVERLVTVHPSSQNPDTDGDGFPDGYEVDQGLNPVDPTDGNEDSDGDGLTNGVEFQLGTNALSEDTDLDGYPDGLEHVVLLTDPLNASDPGEGEEENTDGEESTAAEDGSGDGGETPGSGGSAGSDTGSSSDGGLTSEGSSPDPDTTGDPNNTGDQDASDPDPATNTHSEGQAFLGRSLSFEVTLPDDAGEARADPEYPEFENDFGLDDSSWIASYPDYTSSIDPGSSVPISVGANEWVEFQFEAQKSWDSANPHPIETVSESAEDYQVRTDSANLSDPFTDVLPRPASFWSLEQVVGENQTAVLSTHLDSRGEYPVGVWSRVIAHRTSSDMEAEERKRCILIVTRENATGHYIPEGEESAEADGRWVGTATFVIPANESSSTQVLLDLPGDFPSGYLDAEGGCLDLNPLFVRNNSSREGGAKTEVVLLPVEIASADKFLAGSFEVPKGWDDFSMEVVGPNGEDFGIYGSLLGGGSTRIYDAVTEILNEADLADGGQLADQKVWFVRSGSGDRRLDFYTCFDVIGSVTIRIYPDGTQGPSLEFVHELTAVEDFAETIAYVDAWVKGTSFRWDGLPYSLPPQLLTLASQTNTESIPAAASSGAFAAAIASGVILTAEANVALAPEEVSFSLGSPLDSLPSVNFGQQIQLYPIEAFDLPSDLQLESGAVYWLQENILHQLDEFLVGSLAARSGPFSLTQEGFLNWESRLIFKVTALRHSSADLSAWRNLSPIGPEPASSPSSMSSIKLRAWGASPADFSME